LHLKSEVEDPQTGWSPLKSPPINEDRFIRENILLNVSGEGLDEGRI